MLPNPTKHQDEDNLLEYVRYSIPVFDRDNQHVGVVKFVHLGKDQPDSLTALPDSVAEAPKHIRNYLLREGFIQIETGLSTKDRFATPDQIAELSDAYIALNALTSGLTAL